MVKNSLKKKLERVRCLPLHCEGARGSRDRLFAMALAPGIARKVKKVLETPVDSPEILSCLRSLSDFYPDLIDKTKAPTYAIAPDGSRHGETCILRVSAGPPYEDIAFKIVNKEWEYSNKRGFKCSFERGIFHLYINFKRARYRR